MTGARANVAATLVFAASVLLIASYTPLWCVALALIVAAWRVGVGLGHLPALRVRRGARFLTGAVTAALVVAVAVDFRTINGLAAGSALLVVMGALKLVESRLRRDNAIVIGVALFLLLAAALASQAMWRLPLYLVTVWGACAAIALTAYDGAAFNTSAALKVSARALALSIPLAVACFLFFPRVAGQFWALDRGGEASTGLSDEMSPGAIGKLANEYDPAFRVHFEGALPPRSALYWRGPVLNSFDGFTWRRDRPNAYLEPRLALTGEAVRYRVTLEPTHRSWLFALDTIAENPRHDFILSQDRQLSSMEPVDDVLTYEAVSRLGARSEENLSILGRRHGTQLPQDRNPRTLALAREMRARFASDADYARAVLDFFKSDGLEYTLDPGTTTVDSVDTTLFDSKKGFCGHFASAYATMMRAAGIPARVVTGYLGGEWNAVGGYLIVRQSDAHAWTEVWLAGRGWTRIDPTAVVSPERLERGIFDVLTDSLPLTASFIHRSAWLTNLSHLWDGMNQWWQAQVVDFDLKSQLELLAKLGFDSPGWQELGWAFAAALFAWVAWISLSLSRSVPRTRPDRLARSWLKLTNKLARIGAREPSEGPLDYANRIASLRPDLAGRVRALAAHYARLRFGPAPDERQVEEFRRAARALEL